ncbi:hypothetical protein ULG90_09320 [Halopseudomonas pachastrellae]|nr:hypothetical protein ULG90_09320 [Halopseudomonas pachastrellae]
MRRATCPRIAPSSRLLSLVFGSPALQAAGTSVDHAERCTQLMGDPACHAANGCHFLLVLELGQQAGFGGAALIQLQLCLFDTVEHLVQAVCQGRNFGWALRCRAVSMVTLSNPLHMFQQAIHMAANAAVVPEHHCAKDTDGQYRPGQPGNDFQLVQRATKVAGPPGYLNQP